MSRTVLGVVCGVSFDSTHVSFGVVTAAVNRGPWTLEGSVFNGREPDEHRWNFDFGKMDSVSGRVWYQPTKTWEFQASTGHLVQPEALEPGNVERTTLSASWFRPSDRDFVALTIGYGVNAKEGTNRQAAFGEFTRHVGVTTLSTRVEMLQAETAVLLDDVVPATPALAGQQRLLGTFTLGASREISRWRGFESAIGGDLVFFVAPSVLRPAYGSRPFSFQLYVQIRPPTGSMGRMWNMRMARSMADGHPGM